MNEAVSKMACNILASCPLFAGINKPEIEIMLAHMKLERWPRQSLVMTAEETQQNFYLIIKGRVKISHNHPQNGHGLTLYLLGPGDIFNVISLFDGQRHDVTAETLDEVEALSAPVAEWNHWMEENPVFHSNMHRLIVKQMRQLDELASDLALHDTMTRLAHLILRHFDDQKSSTSRSNLIQDLPHEELAHMIGTVRVVLNRLINELKREDVVTMGAGGLQVQNMEKLLSIAEQHIQGK